MGDVVLDSFHSCITNAPEELSWTPEMSFTEVASQPGMLMHEFKGGIAFKQLQCLANRHCWGQLNKEMHMVWSNMQFINPELMTFSNFMDKPFTVFHDSIELEDVPCIFRFPYKMEGVLPQGVSIAFQIHFLDLLQESAFKAHANSMLHEPNVKARPIQRFKEFKDGGSRFLPSLKAGVSTVMKM